MKDLCKLADFLARQSIHRVPQEVHVEAIVSDVIYIRLLKFLEKHPVLCLVTTPDEPWCEKRIGAESIDLEVYREMLESRY